MMDLGTIRKNLKKSKYIDAYQCAQDIRQVWNNCMTYNEDGSDFYRLGQSYSKRFEERYQKLVDEFGENIVIPRPINDAGDDDDDDGDDDAANEVDKISPEKNGNKSRSNSISTTGKNTPPPPTVKGGTSASKIDKLNNNNTSNNGDDYSANGGSGSGTIVPLDVRTRFAARLQRLSGMELGHVLQVIDLNCPEAIEDPTYDQLTTTDAPHPASMLSHRYMWDEFDGGCQIEIDVDVIPVDTFWELDRYVKEKVNERGRGPWSDDLTTIDDTAAVSAANATVTDVSNGGSSGGGGGGGKKRKKSISSLEMVGK
jgi:hypothetical protein